MKKTKSHVYSPYYIFIKTHNQLTAEKLLQKLDLQLYTLINDPIARQKIIGFSTNPHFFTYQGNQWFHIMDSMLYSLWHEKQLVARLEQLANDYDLFYGSVGDTDESFEFVYYENGSLKRAYTVEDPEYKGGRVTRNIGSPFDVESIALSQNDELDTILMIAASLGITVQHQYNEVDVYIKKTRSFFSFVTS